jgi:hypothetical protein
MQREAVEEASATVVSVDASTRVIQLKGEDGRTGAFTAGPEVRNFAQIRTGDKVIVSYYRGITAQVLPPGSAASKEVNQIDLGARNQPARSRARDSAAPFAVRSWCRRSIPRAICSRF